MSEQRQLSSGWRVHLNPPGRGNGTVSHSGQHCHCSASPGRGTKRGNFDFVMGTRGRQAQGPKQVAAQSVEAELGARGVQDIGRAPATLRRGVRQHLPFGGKNAVLGDRGPKSPSTCCGPGQIEALPEARPTLTLTLPQSPLTFCPLQQCQGSVPSLQNAPPAS